MNRLDQELDDLLARYREACPDNPPSANFMAALWQRIEARRNSRFHLLHLSRLFLSAAAAVWLLIAGVLLLPSSNAPRVHESYVDALSVSNDSDSWTFAEADRPEVGVHDRR